MGVLCEQTWWEYISLRPNSRLSLTGILPFPVNNDPAPKVTSLSKSNGQDVLTEDLSLKVCIVMARFLHILIR